MYCQFAKYVCHVCSLHTIKVDPPYLYFQTDGSVPNTLVIANVEVVKPRVAAAEHISQAISSLLAISLVKRFSPINCYDTNVNLLKLSAFSDLFIAV